MTDSVDTRDATERRNLRFRDLEPGQMRIQGRVVTFALGNHDDHVQNKLSKGRFYEADQLEQHGTLVWRKSTVLDVGANVGNHTVYYALRTRAARVYPFEPNPPAAALLRETVERNAIDEVDLRYVGTGVGAEPGELFVHSPGTNNLGRTMLRGRGEVAVPVVRLDDAEVSGRVSLVKVDVEGMEMAVLSGAEALVADQRPALAVEVATTHLPAFWAWVDAHDYHVMSAHRMYAENVNYVCIPRS